MTEEKKKPEGKKILSDARGRYILIDGQKVFVFEFAYDSTILQNYEAITFLKEEIWNAVVKQKEEEQKQKLIKEKETPKQE